RRQQGREAALLRERNVAVPAHAGADRAEIHGLCVACGEQGDGGEDLRHAAVARPGAVVRGLLAAGAARLLVYMHVVVMAGPVPAIHVFAAGKAWMPAFAGMTDARGSHE